MKKMNKPALHLVHHFILGFMLAVKGYDKLHHHELPGTIILIFGIIILGYAFWSLLTKAHNPKFEILFHVFETIVMCFTAFIFFEEGKKYLPYVCLLAAAAFLVAAVIQFWKLGKNR